MRVSIFYEFELFYKNNISECIYKYIYTCINIYIFFSLGLLSGKKIGGWIR